MKKLIELGHTQATIMDKILKEEWLYKPKLASKFTIEHIPVDEDYTKHYLSYSGNKLDSTFFGCLMYRLGMEAQKEYSKG